MTQQVKNIFKELEAKEEEEVDKLVDFMGNLDYDNYVNDVEVNAMLGSLKQRIDQIKEEKLLVQKLKEE